MHTHYRSHVKIFFRHPPILVSLGLALALGGLRLVALPISLEQVSAALQINLGYVYFVLPLSGLLIMFYSGSQLFEHVLALSGKGIATDSRQKTSPTITLD